MNQPFNYKCQIGLLPFRTMESILKPKHAIVVVAGIYFELSNSSMIFCAKERLVHHKLTVQKMHEIAQTVSKKSKKSILILSQNVFLQK